VFWLLYAILLRPKERAIIEKIIAPAFSPSSSDLNVETLSDLNVLLSNAPLLNSMFWEALRSVSCLSFHFSSSNDQQVCKLRAFYA
jgi:hypothetical protein